MGTAGSVIVNAPAAQGAGTPGTPRGWTLRKEPSMSRSTVADPFKRHRTRHRGITYRTRADGSRSYAVYFRGRYVPAGTTEREALAKQAELRGKEARGERILLAAKVTLAEDAEAWYEDASRRLKPGVVKEYRSALDRVILPRWGHRRIGSIGPSDVLALANELRASGLSESTVSNYLKPARATFEHAVLAGHIAVSPFAQVPRGRLPSCNSRRDHREWTTADIQRLIACGYELDARPEARAEYGLLIEAKIRLGLRLGELLGVQYGDFVAEEVEPGQRVYVLRVARQWTKDGRVDTPKTPKALRRIPVSQDLYAKIAARRLRLGASDEDFLSAQRKGGTPVSHHNFRRRAWNAAVERAGFTDGPKVTPHDARHAFASQLADLGLSSSDLAEAMGHTTSGVTEAIYVHAFNRDAREERVRQAMTAAMTGGAS